jgi:hypothetical protein
MSTQQHHPLAVAALAAMTDPKFTTAGGWCSQFVRLCAEDKFGSKWSALFGGSAATTCANFRRAGYCVDGRGVTPKDGDILFKPAAGRFGHVGIFVAGRGVAENSTTTLGRISGAKGFRTLAQFGEARWIGRLPK